MVAVIDETVIRVAVVVVREFDPKKDSAAVEEVERRCEVGPSGELSLFTDLLGDPVSRVRNSPEYLMLVAEMVVVGGGDNKEHREIVGMVRGCIKTVTCGKKFERRTIVNTNNSNNDDDDNNNVDDDDDDHHTTAAVPVFTKLAYILGLRVSPFHRRMGIGHKLVCRMEQWFKDSGAEYSYMATENDNLASIKLFTHKCGYSKFRTPSILVQPVFAHRVRISNRVRIVKLGVFDAEKLYRGRFSTTEFFPSDIDSILNNRLNLGTYLAFSKEEFKYDKSWPGIDEFLASQVESWAVLSVWNTNDVFKLEVRGASRMRRTLAKTTRLVDRVLPWLQLPSVPEVFRPFGLHFLYGLGGEGPLAIKLTKALCGFAHNLAKKHGCGVVATEVSCQDPLKSGVPRWKRLSCDEDLWCIKRLREDYNTSIDDWTKSSPGVSLFVDPREF